MNYTKAKIFNITLKNLGISTGIQSATQNDRNTVVLNEFYDSAKEKTLKDYDWAFASTYRELALTGNNCLNPKFQFEYDYPNDCIFVREIISPETAQATEYEISSTKDGQKVILTNASHATIRHTRLIEDECYMPSEFAIAFSWFLAFLSAESITGIRTKTSDCLQIYKTMLSEARTADANEGRTKSNSDSDWIEARD